MVFNSFNKQTEDDFLEALQELYDGIRRVFFKVDQGHLLFRVEGSGGRVIPATHLSDGTLRDICLLLVLLHPSPPPLIAIEEPETGLHPDVIPALAKLLVEASHRTQLIVTTHLHMLIDALHDLPASVVVCARKEGQSRFERLDSENLEVGLRRYSLGELWNIGKIGGNRWQESNFTLKAATAVPWWPMSSEGDGATFLRPQVCQPESPGL